MSKRASQIAVPSRYSEPIDLAFARESEGLIKFRLGHAPWGSFVAVDALFTERQRQEGRWSFYIPTFYGPPRLMFGMPEEAGAGSPHVLLMSADLCAPNHDRPTRVMLTIRSKDQVRVYPDGAQLFRCTIRHDRPLEDHRSGRARRRGDDFDLQVFHHTSAATIPLIRKSGHFRGSPWNFQGVRKLTNVCYPYFTTVKRVRNEDDLRRIAMSSDEMLVMRGMGLLSDPVVEMKVLRSTTADRRATLPIWVPVGVVSPNHIRIFRPPDGEAYYEVVLPEVLRVGLKPGCVLPIQGDRAVPDDADLRTFDYVICGDAANEDGLLAPFDEENTEQILHLENLQTEDVFEFWQRNQNSDQVSGRKPKPRLLEPRAE